MRTDGGVGKINGQDRRQKKKSTGLLPGQQGGGGYLAQEIAVPNRKQGGKNSGDHAQQDPGSELPVKVKDQVDPQQDDQSQRAFDPAKFCTQQQRLEQSGKKSDGSKADQRDGYVGVFDGPVEG